MIVQAKRSLRHFDWISFFLILLLSSIGLLCVFSATYRPEHPFSLFFYKQLGGIISGLCIYMLFSLIDYRVLQQTGYFFYFATIALLICTSIKGSIGMGAQRWINIGIVKFQPSELTKLFFPAYFTYSLAHTPHYSPELATFLPIIGTLFASALLILKQPDLGTALIILGSGGILLWLAGLPTRFFVITGISILISAPVLWTHLKPYQKQRIAVFLGEGDSRKERYQIEQSHIAIGSGGVWGKGFLQGTQNKLQFLPESRTDFIFSVLGEEWGFLGTLFIIILYALLFTRLIYIAMGISNFQTQLLAAGLIIPLFLSTIINMGMVIGLLPIVGIPLPFMTYGISHLWITFASLGWFNNIASHRFLLKN